MEISKKTSDCIKQSFSDLGEVVIEEVNGMIRMSIYAKGPRRTYIYDFDTNISGITKTPAWDSIVKNLKYQFSQSLAKN